MTSWSAWPGTEAGQLDLFVFELRAAGEEDWSLLSEHERRRGERLVIESKRDQFVVSRASLRRLLGRALERDPGAVEFQYGEHDKPAVVDGRDWTFNLSHSHQLAVIGVARSIDALGIDLEYARPGRDFLGISRSFFSPGERRVLAEHSDEERGAAFYRAWSRKEAYLKALGTGLSFASSRFTIEYRRQHRPAVLATEYPGDDPADWRMLDLEIQSEYAAAACWRGPKLHVRQWALDASEPVSRRTRER